MKLYTDLKCVKLLLKCKFSFQNKKDIVKEKKEKTNKNSKQKQKVYLKEL